jgi:hypothetical protein
MVFENIEKVIEAVKAYQTVPSWVEAAREYHTKQKALVYGDKFKDLILTIQHIESEKKAKARKKYSRPIKDIYSKLTKPVSNIYSATGGCKNYDVSSEQQKADLLKRLSNIRGGYSLERWLETFWSKDLYLVDPSGLMFLEWKDEEAYPTYKSIESIRYYKSNGLNVEFVIFEPKTIKDKDIKLWRVVDDDNDYVIKQIGEVFTDTEDSEKHTFGKCPGRINSDVQQFGKDYRLSPLDDILEASEETLSDRSIKTVYKFLNGFSIPYRPKIICPTCRGTKKQGVEVCKGCDGKGVVLDKDVTDEIIIPIDLNSDKQIPLPTNFAGFISPDLEIWNQYTQEEQNMTNLMFETIWGTRESEVKDQTAQGAFLNIQPMVTRLNAWSNIAESNEWYFTELLANFYTDKDKDKRISVITYGRNYILQPPSYLLGEYQKSKEKNDPVTILDRKLTEFLTSKYKNDPETLRSELVKKDLEPFVHYSVELVMDIYGAVEAQKKGLFTDWWETLESDDIAKSQEALEKERDKWVNAKLKEMAIVPANQNIQT